VLGWRKWDALYFESVFFFTALEIWLRAFRHAIQTSQVASLSNANAQIIVLSAECIGQEIRKRFRLVHGCHALLECAPPLRHLDRWHSSRGFNARFSYCGIGCYSPCLYCAYRRSETMFATSCGQSQRGRHRPHLSHRRHQEG
jgi:hypothetical protein